MREATLVSDDTNLTETLAILADALRDHFRTAVVKRAVVAALGETLFYACSQNDNKATWAIPSSILPMLVRCLQSAEDATTQHYAAKIIENISALQGEFALRIATFEIVSLLWTLFSKSALVHLRRSCVTAVVRLGFKNPELIQRLADVNTPASIVSALQEPFAPARQQVLSVILLALADSASLPRLCTAIIEDANTVAYLMQQFESGTTPIRAKAYLALSRVLRGNDVAMSVAVKSKLLSVIDRDVVQLQSDNSSVDVDDASYCHSCINHVVASIVAYVPQLVLSLREGLILIAGRKHPSATHARSIKPKLQAFPMLLSITSSSSLAAMMLEQSFFDSMARLIEHMPAVASGEMNLNEVSDHAREDYIDTCFGYVETIIQQASKHLLTFTDIVITRILAAFVALWSCKDSSIRLVAIRCTAEILLSYASHVGRDAATEHYKGHMREWLSAITGLARDQIVQCLNDAPPVPIFAVSILYSLLRLDASLIRIVDDDVMVSTIALLQPEDSPDTVDNEHVVRLVREIVRHTNAPISALLSHSLVPKLCSALHSAVVNQDMAQSQLVNCMESIYYVLKNVAESARAAIQAKKSKTGQTTDLGQVAETCLKLCQPLTTCIDKLAMMLISDDVTVNLNAVRCLSLLLQLYPAFGRGFVSESNLLVLVTVLESSKTFMHALVLKLVSRAISHSRPNASIVAQSTAFIDVVIRMSMGEDEHVADMDADLNASLRVVASSALSSKTLAAEIVNACEAADH